MSKCKGFLGALLILSFICTITMGTTVFAKDGVDGIFAADSGASTVASSTITGPDGYTYTYLGTATRSGATNTPVSASFASTITASDNYHIVFYCPNNSKQDLAQGQVTATPVLSGTEQTYSFLNCYNELSTVDLSSLSGTGAYTITITVNAIGTSNKGDVYYRLYQ